jgi:hypothetical protein
LLVGIARISGCTGAGARWADSTAASGRFREHVGYKELNESGEFVIPGFAKMSVVSKPATEARSGVNPFTKEPMEFVRGQASQQVGQGVTPEGC